MKKLALLAILTLSCAAATAAPETFVDPEFTQSAYVQAAPKFVDPEFTQSAYVQAAPKFVDPEFTQSAYVQPTVNIQDMARGR